MGAPLVLFVMVGASDTQLLEMYRNKRVHITHYQPLLYHICSSQTNSLINVRNGTTVHHNYLAGHKG